MPDKIHRLTFLWRGAQYQDSLLQAYRSFHFIIQSILLAIGAALSVAVVVTDDQRKAWAIYSLLVIVTALALRFLNMMRKLILARRDDVNYFHHHILETEKEVNADEQVLTQFKTYQKFHKKNANSAANFSLDLPSESMRQQLLEKDREHTRQLLDANASVYFLIVWGLFHVVVALAAMI